MPRNSLWCLGRRGGSVAAAARRRGHVGRRNRCSSACISGYTRACQKQGSSPSSTQRNNTCIAAAQLPRGHPLEACKRAPLCLPCILPPLAAPQSRCVCSSASNPPSRCSTQRGTGTADVNPTSGRRHECCANGRQTQSLPNIQRHNAAPRRPPRAAPAAASASAPINCPALRHRHRPCALLGAPASA
jgi:hypothetical protein